MENFVKRKRKIIGKELLMLSVTLEQSQLVLPQISPKGIEVFYFISTKVLAESEYKYK